MGDKTLFIRGSGKLDDYNLNKAPWGDFKNTICLVVIDEGVKSIRIHALSGFRFIKRVTIQSSVIEINSNPFIDCSVIEIEVSGENQSSQQRKEFFLAMT